MFFVHIKGAAEFSDHGLQSSAGGTQSGSGSARKGSSLFHSRPSLAWITGI